MPLKGKRQAGSVPDRRTSCTAICRAGLTSPDLDAAELAVLDEQPGCDVVIGARPDVPPEPTRLEPDPAAPGNKTPLTEPTHDCRVLALRPRT